MLTDRLSYLRRSVFKPELRQYCDLSSPGLQKRPWRVSLSDGLGVLRSEVRLSPQGLHLFGR